jgi:hypothetical protein
MSVGSDRLIVERKEIQMMKLELVNVEFCEVCDNYTPNVHIEEAGEYGCELCYNAYGVEGMEF